MIYDYQDSCTKLSLARQVRDWSKKPANAAIIVQNLQVKELTDLEVSPNSTDDVVWTILYLIGLGLLYYAVDEFVKDGQPKIALRLMLDPHWQEPRWVHDKAAVTNLKNHVDLMMDMLDNPMLKGMETVALRGSLDVIKIKRRRLTKPKPPVVANRDWERKTIRARRLEERQRIAFYRR